MVAKKKILYSVASNSGGFLVNAEEAVKGTDYFCPVCESKLVLRKSGNTGINSKRPHFAHKVLTQNCTPESALHYSFKMLAYEHVKTLLSTSESFKFNWTCQYCAESHVGDLLKKAKDVKLEYHLGVCQPDITLLDDKEKVYAVLEIVVTHEPEDQVKKYYEDNRITLVQYNLINDSELFNINERLSRPDLVNFCFNPKCNVCGHYQHRLLMMIVETACYKCGSDMKCAVIHSPNGGMIRGSSNYLKPDEFTEEEIALARDKGVILTRLYSKKAYYTSLANTCGKCKSIIGNHYLWVNHVSEAEFGRLQYSDYELGYHCEICSYKISEYKLNG